MLKTRWKLSGFLFFASCINYYASAEETPAEAENQTLRYAFLAVEGNYVDGIIDPNAGSGTETSDYSVSALAAGDMGLMSSASIDWNMGASLYQESYRDFDIYNIGSANLNTTLYGYLPDWRFKARLGYSKLWLDSDAYLNEATAVLGAKWKINKQYQWRVQAKLIEVNEADAEFARHQGWVDEQQIELKYRGARLDWSIDFTARDESREDLRFIFSTSANPDIPLRGFTSYSFASSRWRLKSNWQWSANWRQSISVARRDADYDSPDIFANPAGQVQQVLRKTERTDFELELGYSINQTVGCLLRYAEFNAHSNNDNYDYKSRVVSLGIDWFI